MLLVLVMAAGGLNSGREWPVTPTSAVRCVAARSSFDHCFWLPLTSELLRPPRQLPLSFPFPELPTLLSTSQTLSACPQLGVDMKVIVASATHWQRKDDAISTFNVLMK